MSVESEMKKIDEAIFSCKLCGLSKGRTNSVPGTGPPEVEAVFVGEAPGRNEDLEGKPFVGAGGKLLDELLRNAGLKREDIYITNVVKCRPPNNRKPEHDEITTCTKNYLENQLELLKPLLIVTLGATALEYFTGRKIIGELRGKLTKTKKGVVLLPTYHPAAVFRTPSYRELLQKDLNEIPEILSKLRKKDKQTALTSFSKA